MKLVSTVSSDQETWSCDYALVDLNPDLARLALRRINLFKVQKKADQQLDEMYFWDFHVEYFSPWNAEEEDSAGSLSEMLNKLPLVAGDLMCAPDDFAVPGNLFARIECSQMVIRADAIAFIAIPKHASYYVRTSEVPLHLIEAVASA